MTHKTQDNTRDLKRLGNTRSRSWCFTLNNYTENEIKMLLTHFTPAILYIFQEEKGKEGTPHLQGVVRYANARTFKSLKKINSRLHLEKCKTLKGSINYCNKEESRIGRQWKKGVDKYIVKTKEQEEREFKEWLDKKKYIIIQKMRESLKDFDMDL